MEKEGKEVIKNAKVTVSTLGRVFGLIQSMEFTEVPIVNESGKEINEDFITIFILELAKDRIKLNQFFNAITTEDSRDFSDDDLGGLCEVAQNFFLSIPARFMNTLKLMSEEQERRKIMATQEIAKAAQKMLSNDMLGIPTIDKK